MLYLLMMELDTPETCRGWRNILTISLHQVGFSLHNYIEMHGQQNIKNETLLVARSVLHLFASSMVRVTIDVLAVKYNCTVNLHSQNRERRNASWFTKRVFLAFGTAVKLRAMSHFRRQRSRSLETETDQNIVPWIGIGEVMLHPPPTRFMCAVLGNVHSV